MSRVDVWKDGAVRVRVGASSREGAHVGFLERKKMEAEANSGDQYWRKQDQREAWYGDFCALGNGHA